MAHLIISDSDESDKITVVPVKKQVVQIGRTGYTGPYGHYGHYNSNDSNDSTSYGELDVSKCKTFTKFVAVLFLLCIIVTASLIGVSKSAEGDRVKVTCKLEHASVEDGTATGILSCDYGDSQKGAKHFDWKLLDTSNDPEEALEEFNDRFTTYKYANLTCIFALDLDNSTDCGDCVHSQDPIKSVYIDPNNFSNYYICWYIRPAFLHQELKETDACDKGSSGGVDVAQTVFVITVSLLGLILLMSVSIVYKCPGYLGPEGKTW